jgi:phosphomannomutase
MNRAVVIRAAAGLTAYLRRDLPDALGGPRRSPFVVVGFDARHRSDDFARDTAAVVVAAGGRAAVLPHVLPTPVLAFAIRHLGADAGVMVTASHNPPQDNGYKVYLGDGSQIVPPADAGIAARIAEVTSVASVPRATDGWETLGEDVLDAYLAAVAALVGEDAPRDVQVVHTSLHGVGNDTVAGFRAGWVPGAVWSWRARHSPTRLPDGALPQPGGARGDRRGVGSRGAATPMSSSPTTRTPIGAPSRCSTTGAGGCCAATRSGHCSAPMSSLGACPRGVFANSIVSSRMLSAMAAAAGVPHEETLTGFKWIARVPGLAYGYEEALGYCVAPTSCGTRTASRPLCSSPS